jgi:hypothetical protein
MMLLLACQLRHVVGEIHGEHFIWLTKDKDEMALLNSC